MQCGYPGVQINTTPNADIGTGHQPITTNIIAVNFSGTSPGESKWASPVF
jgi:hypothetical protein